MEYTTGNNFVESISATAYRSISTKTVERDGDIVDVILYKATEVIDSNIENIEITTDIVDVTDITGIGEALEWLSTHSKGEILWVLMHKSNVCNYGFDFLKIPDRGYVQSEDDLRMYLIFDYDNKITVFRNVILRGDAMKRLIYKDAKGRGFLLLNDGIIYYDGGYPDIEKESRYKLVFDKVNDLDDPHNYRLIWYLEKVK